MNKLTAWDKYPKIFIDSFYNWERIGVTTHHKVAELLLKENPESILEIGCGPGVLYQCLLDAGYNLKYRGIDKTSAFVSYCQERFDTGLFEQGDADTKNIRRLYDVGVMMDVLRHNPIADRYKILDNVVPHILKKLVLTEPIGDEDTQIWNQDIPYTYKNETVKMDYWDGTLNLSNLVTHIHRVKPVKDFDAVTRDVEFNQDPWDNMVITIEFEEDNNDSQT